MTTCVYISWSINFSGILKLGRWINGRHKVMRSSSIFLLERALTSLWGGRTGFTSKGPAFQPDQKTFLVVRNVMSRKKNKQAIWNEVQLIWLFCWSCKTKTSINFTFWLKIIFIKLNFKIALIGYSVLRGKKGIPRPPQNKFPKVRGNFDWLVYETLLILTLQTWGAQEEEKLPDD